jgi:hypothetical protein
VHPSFQGIKSTDAALALLRQFRSVLQRDGLRSDLETMHAVRRLALTLFHLAFSLMQ